MTKKTERAKIKELIRRQEGEGNEDCGGACSGIGTVLEWYIDACGDEVDDQMLAQAEHIAKAKAFQNAQDRCQQSNKSCHCLNGEYEAVVPPQAVSIDNIYGEGEGCVFIAVYTYTGECTKWF